MSQLDSQYHTPPTRQAVSGFDPLLNAYFLSLVENNQEVTNPLLFPFHGEDDSPSALVQQQKMARYKAYWEQDGKSADDIIDLHAMDVPQLVEEEA